MNYLTPLPNSPEARDIAYHLHGYTNAITHKEIGPMIIDRDEGIYVYDNNDHSYIEALSGLWSVAVGFNEPRLINAAVVVPPATYWEKFQAVLNKYDILLIANEVICGFSRTGQMFGSHTYGIKPDVMVMSKQITSSYVPFTAFMMNEIWLKMRTLSALAFATTWPH